MAGEKNWEDASLFCTDLVLDDSAGWRLPTLKELMSLVDFSGNDPVLPTGHLFIDVQSKFYWTSISVEGLNKRAWSVDMSRGCMRCHPKEHSDGYVWPVRDGD